MSTWQSYTSQNHDMIDKFTRLAIITSKEVENAFRCVSRAAFVSKELLDEAFMDAPIRGNPHIHMSAPHMYAAILEDLELEPGMSFLNIGCGTGYFSCLAGYILKHHGVNHGVELHEDLVEFSRLRVLDFLTNGPADAKEICPPLFIAGNCFQLDPSQLKYDRLYCGGACSQSTITFFLEFLKVGGFLIAPVGTKLIKLERVSHKEGVKTVISDVCFAPLTRLDPNDIMKLKHGLLPLLRFPIQTKKQKPKKTIFANTNFPVSNSPARKKVSRLRAIQHALDCLEQDGSIPLPLCYVPQLDQMNAYKQYKKVVECRTPVKNISGANSSNTTNASISTSLSPVHAAAIDNRTQINPTTSRQTTSNQTTASPLMTIQEFLLAASPPSVFNEFFGTSRHDSSTRNENREQETFLGPRIVPRENTNDNELRERLNESLINVLSQNRSTEETSPTRNVTVVDKLNSTDFDIGDKISKDIWEHLSTDKLWETVVDYYYSVCSTTSDRKKKCFELKGIEIVNPAAAKLADVLLFKMQKNKTSKKASEKKETSPQSENTHKVVVNVLSEIPGATTCNPATAPSVYLEEAPRSRQHNNEKNDIETVETSTTCTEDVKYILDILIDKVCLQTDNPDAITAYNEASNISSESIDSVLSIPSLNCTDEGNSASFEIVVDNDNTSTPVKRPFSKKKPRYVDIRTDNETSDNLSKVTHQGWTVDHDVELISFLVSQGKETEVFTLRDNLPKVINEDIFEKSTLIKYPLISSFPTQILSYRSIALVRIAKLVDSVLDLLVGPSLERNQFNNPFEERYPLSSFTNSSFEVSDSQLNVLEAQNFKENNPSLNKENEEQFNYQEAKSSQDEELLKEVNSMIAYELNNVKQQQLILMRKLQLIDNIDEQYKEQIKLLNQQVDLVEEQQRLLYEVNIDAGCSQMVATHLANSQQMVADRKQQRQSLISKRDRITADRNVQLAERKELLSMLEQLLSLETRLKNELLSLERKGMGYLRGQGSDLSNFSQFVRKAEKILSRLKTASIRMTDILDQKKIVDDYKVKKTNAKPDLRYDPHTVLPRCRFLLPLSKKRYSYIKEMLRTTERSAPRHMPVINVDRRVPVSERHTHDIESTVFMQIYQSLKNKDLHYRWNKKSYEQWWEVKFSGEGIIDQGGGFRDSLTEISEELCPSEANTEICLPLFIKTPNQKSGAGEYLECYTFNPHCKHLHLYHWLGQLMGACFRTDETLPIPLPPFIWKLLVGEHVSWKKDYIQIDEAVVRNIDGLENLDEDAYIGLNVEQTYTSTLSDEITVELIPNGKNIVVKCSERSSYSVLVRKSRMMESCKQVKAVRDGLLTVIPEAVLSCLTWKNLEKGICGDPCISLADLKANCRYGDDLKPTCQCILHMWTALSSFTNDERSRFVRFITGRKRLPSPFIVSRSSVDKDNLPSASTCGSNLFLPEYSSVQIAKEKLKYAIYNCIAIDTDTSPW